MMSVQGEVRHQQLLAVTGPGASRPAFGSDRGGELFAAKAEPPSLSLVSFESPDSLEGLCFRFVSWDWGLGIWELVIFEECFVI